MIPYIITPCNVFVSVCVCPKKILKNASSRVANAFTDVIVNEIQSA